MNTTIAERCVLFPTPENHCDPENEEYSGENPAGVLQIISWHQPTHPIQPCDAKRAIYSYPLTMVAISQLVSCVSGSPTTTPAAVETAIWNRFNDRASR